MKRLDPRRDDDHLDREVVSPIVEAEGAEGDHVLGVVEAVLANESLGPGATVNLRPMFSMLPARAPCPPW